MLASSFSETSGKRLPTDGVCRKPNFLFRSSNHARWNSNFLFSFPPFSLRSGQEVPMWFRAMEIISLWTWWKYIFWRGSNASFHFQFCYLCACVDQNPVIVNRNPQLVVKKWYSIGRNWRHSTNIMDFDLVLNVTGKLPPSTTSSGELLPFGRGEFSLYRFNPIHGVVLGVCVKCRGRG